MDYRQKYLKYKAKYLALHQTGGDDNALRYCIEIANLTAQRNRTAPGEARNLLQDALDARRKWLGAAGIYAATVNEFIQLHSMDGRSADENARLAELTAQIREAPAPAAHVPVPAAAPAAAPEAGHAADAAPDAGHAAAYDDAGHAADAAPNAAPEAAPAAIHADAPEAAPEAAHDDAAALAAHDAAAAAAAAHDAAPEAAHAPLGEPDVSSDRRIARYVGKRERRQARRMERTDRLVAYEDQLAELESNKKKDKSPDTSLDKDLAAGELLFGDNKTNKPQSAIPVDFDDFVISALDTAMEEARARGMSVVNAVVRARDVLRDAILNSASGPALRAEMIARVSQIADIVSSSVDEVVYDMAEHGAIGDPVAVGGFDHRYEVDSLIPSLANQRGGDACDDKQAELETAREALRNETETKTEATRVLLEADTKYREMRRERNAAEAAHAESKSDAEKEALDKANLLLKEQEGVADHAARKQIASTLKHRTLQIRVNRLAAEVREECRDAPAAEPTQEERLERIAELRRRLAEVDEKKKQLERRAKIDSLREELATIDAARAAEAASEATAAAPAPGADGGGSNDYRTEVDALISGLNQSGGEKCEAEKANFTKAIKDELEMNDLAKEMEEDARQKEEAARAARAEADGLADTARGAAELSNDAADELTNCRHREVSAKESTAVGGGSNGYHNEIDALIPGLSKN